MRLLNRIPKPALVVIGGSLPPGISPTFLGQLVEMLRRSGVSSVVDVPGPILKKVVSARPIFIKPNLVEFHELIGKKVDSISGVLKEAIRLTRRVPIVCVSSVENGALLVTQKSAWFGRTPKVSIRTTVGAGDSMVGAITARLWRWQVHSHFEKQFEPLPEQVASDLLRWAGVCLCNAHDSRNKAGWNEGNS